MNVWKRYVVGIGSRIVTVEECHPIYVASIHDPCWLEFRESKALAYVSHVDGDSISTVRWDSSECGRGYRRVHLYDLPDHCNQIGGASLPPSRTGYLVHFVSRVES